MEAYEIEKEIFKRVMKIGLTAMKGYFAVQGTGDIGGKLKDWQWGYFIKRQSETIWTRLFLRLAGLNLFAWK